MRRNAFLGLTALFAVSFCLPGCSAPSWWGAKRGHSIPGVTAPYERIAKLRDQREAARKMPHQTAEQLAAELAPQCGPEEDPMIRAEMVLTLGALNSPTARQALVAAAQDPDGRVRIAVCKAWTEIADETASSELAKIFASDTDKNVRVAAAKGLGKVGGPHAVGALGTALEDRDPSMQFVAMEGLRQVSGQDFGRDARLWKQYVQGQTPQPQEKGLAQRVREIF